MRIHGWGRYPIVDADIVLPSSSATVRSAVGERSDDSVIARGLGRSYGDSSLAAHVINTCHLDLLLGFDGSSGIVRCSAGVSLADLVEVFVPRGWFLPVTPGTKYVTVGGAIASDVHGKNHHLNGCFSEYVEQFDLLLADGSIVSCSRSEHLDLFHASCGGMGLTGIVLEASIRLIPVQSAFIEQTTVKARNLEEVLAHFETHHGATYSVAWIDCLASGEQMGRSLLMLGEHSQVGPLVTTSKRHIAIPVDMPSQLLNRFSIQLFNTLYYHRIRDRQTLQRVHYESFFYPLDGIHHWNRLYGKNGFTQYQFVIPKQAGLEAMSGMLKRILASRRGSFLAVLKVLGKANENPVSFPMEGYTLALDFKLDDGLFGFLDELDAMVLDYGGRLYLAKDARMSEATFKRSYPLWQAFQAVRDKYGAKGKFASHQSRRIGLD
jgi:decaprenylphospho-beta-D-ribofuranose 2-oxidase